MDYYEDDTNNFDPRLITENSIRHSEDFPYDVVFSELDGTMGGEGSGSMDREIAGGREILHLMNDWIMYHSPYAKHGDTTKIMGAKLLSMLYCLLGKSYLEVRSGNQYLKQSNLPISRGQFIYYVKQFQLFVSSSIANRQ